MTARKAPDLLGESGTVGLQGRQTPKWAEGVNDPETARRCGGVGERTLMLDAHCAPDNSRRYMNVTRVWSDAKRTSKRLQRPA